MKLHPGNILKLILCRRVAVNVIAGIMVFSTASAQITLDQVRGYVDRQQYRILTFQEQITWSALYPEFGERMLPVSATACETPGETPADVLVLRICMQVEDSALYAFVPFKGSGYESVCTLDGRPLEATSSELAPDASSAVHLSTRLTNFADTLTQYHQLRLKLSKNLVAENLVLSVIFIGIGAMYLSSDQSTTQAFAGLSLAGGAFIGYQAAQRMKERGRDKAEVSRLEAKLTVGF
jgi:hypothetical protein